MAGQGRSRRWARNARKLATKKKSTCGGDWRGKQDARKIAFLGRKRLHELIPVSEGRLDRGHDASLIPRPWSSGKEWMRPREHPGKTACFTGEKLGTDST